MPRNFPERWQCQTCVRHFPSDQELQKHIEAFQSRTQHLLAELQRCFAHSDPNLSDEEDCGNSDDDNADNVVNSHCDDRKRHQCPHIECEGKRPRALFSWKNLLRHYTIHVLCRETCAFCGLNIDRVRKYVTHFDDCKAKKKDGRGPEFYLEQTNAAERRMILRNRAAQELKLKASTRANMLDGEFSSQEVGSRKRAAEMADIDLENGHQSRKLRIAKENDGDATIAPGTEDMATETATPAHFGMPSNSALGPTNSRASLPSHCDLDKSTSSGNAGTYSSGSTDFLQYPLEREGTFMGNQYMGTFGGAPTLFSHTVDGSSNFHGQEYEITAHTSSRPMDGSSSLSAEQQYEAVGLYRAPLFASNTLDGSYQSVCHYETSAQSRVPSAEYDTVDRRESDAQLANKEMTALYGTSQTVQMFIPATVHYG